MLPDARIHRLLNLLMDHPTIVLSGTKMAAELGVPRSTLRGWIVRLREVGVDLKGVPATGYQLARLPDVLTPGQIRGSGSLGHRVHHYFKIGSTMDEANRLALEGEPHGTLVIAEEQTAGRGRLGRAWHSERGAGLYFSLILRPALPAAAAPLLTLATGIAVATGIAEVTDLETDIRWPNDVLVLGKKCSGMLLEMTAEPERIRFVIVGIGVNVNQSAMPKELQDEATSLRLGVGRAVSRLDLLAALLRSLERAYARLTEAGGRAGLVNEFEGRSSFARGRRVSVEENGTRVTGSTAGLDDSGYLLLKRDDSGALEPIYTGQIRPL